jgi:hypothetical protein
MGEDAIDFIQYLPGGHIAIIGMTYVHIKNKTIRAMEKSWRKGWGLKEYDFKTGEGDYVKFRKPPQSWIENMVEPPNDWSYSISFPNGTTFEMVSLANIEQHRGSSFDAAMIDEMAKCPEDAFDEVISQFIRGNSYIPQFKWLDYNPDTGRGTKPNHYHHAVHMFTTIPWLPSQQWIYRFEKLAKDNPEEYYWMEGNVYDNADVLTIKWINDQAKILGGRHTIKFRVELMNERISQIPNGFYHAFNEKRNVITELDIKNYYRGFGIEYEKVETILSLTEAGEYNLVHQIVQSLGAENKFVNPDEPLDSTWDFNASLNTVTILQENKHSNTVRAMKGFSVEHQSFLDNVDAICNHYADNQCKVIYLYGDRNGNKVGADNTPSFFQQIIARFATHGWTAILVSEGGIGTKQNHDLRYQVSNTVMLNNHEVIPKFEIHSTTNQWLIISIQNTAVKNGFEKDKSSETKFKGEKRKLATDWGDGIDYYFYDKYGSALGHSYIEMPMMIL